MALVNKVVNSLGLFVLVPLTLKYLGEEQYGIYLAIVSIMALISFGDFGFGFGVQNRIPHIKEKRVEVKRLVSTAFFLLLILSVIFITIFFFITRFANWNIILNLNEGISSNIVISSLYSIIFVIFLTIPFSLIQRIQQGFLKGYIFEAWSILGGILSFLSTFFLIHVKAPMHHLILSQYGIPVVILILNFVLTCARKPNWFLPSVYDFDFKVVKNVWKESIIYFFVVTSYLAANFFDSLLIKYNLSSQELIKYSNGFRLANLIIIPITIWCSYSLPVINEKLINNMVGEARQLVVKNYKLTTIYSFILALANFLAINFVIKIWVGDEYLYSPIEKISFSFLIIHYGLQAFISFIMITDKFLLWTLVFLTLSTIVVLCLKFILIKQYSYIGIIFSNVIGFGILFQVLSFYKLKSNHII